MFGGKDFKAVWGKNGRRQETESEHTHTPRDLWDAVRFGKELPFSPTNETWKSSLPGKGPDWMASRQPSARLSERVPPPPAHFLLPSPSPSGCSSSHSGFIIVPTPVPLLPGKSLQPGSLAGTCCLLVGANIAPYLHSVSLCQGQTTQGLDASQGHQPESLHPTAWVARQAHHPCPTVDCTQARREVRASSASMQENARTQWGGIKAKIT